jgi:hypothetical protein
VNRFRKDGEASGLFPVITLPQVKHVENIGGYSRLLNMTCLEAKDLADKGARLHTKWVREKGVPDTHRGRRVVDTHGRPIPNEQDGKTTQSEVAGQL